MANHDTVILMAGDAGYAFPLATALRSVRDHAGVCADVIVVDFGLGAEGREIVARSGFDIEFVDRPSWIDDFAGVSKWPAVYFARLRPELYTQRHRRVLWLDGDILVRDDLRNLLTADLHGRPLGAAPTDRDALLAYPDEYIPLAVLELEGCSLSSRMFNAGVLLVDLERWIQDGVGDRVAGVAQRHVLSDQESLNVALWNQWYPLQRTWNGRLPTSSLFHFAGGAKPWRSDYFANSLLLEYRQVAKSVGWELDHSAAKLARATVRPAFLRAKAVLVRD